MGISKGTNPECTVIVAARDARVTIQRCLHSLLNLRFRRFELIVVDDASTDDTPQLVEEFIQQHVDKLNVKLLRSTHRTGPSAARNRAARIARGQYLAFTDADCELPAHWLDELLRGIELFPEAVSCGGGQDLPASATPFERRVHTFLKRVGFATDYMRPRRSSRIRPVTHNASCNVLYKRDTFLSVGGFAPGLWPGEDVDLDYRLRKAGHTLVCNPRAAVYHHRPRNLATFGRMMYRYGWAQGILVRKHGLFRRIHAVPFATLAGALLVALLPRRTRNTIVVVSGGALGGSGFGRMVLLTACCWNSGFVLGVVKPDL